MAARGNPYQRSYTTAERDAEIARYCIGRTVSEAAEHFGVNKSTISRARARAIDAVIRPAGEEAKAAELLELDALAVEAWQVLRANHIHVSDGRVVRDDGQPILDHKPVLMAIDRILRIQERRARLMGYDAPTRKVVEVLTNDVVDQAIAQELAAMEALDAGRSADREAAAAPPATS